MRIRAITLENVRRFTAPVRVEGIGDGINVLCEPNEAGKSTLFDAVEALFLVPHGSQARDVKALRPHGGGAPQVSVEIEVGAQVYTVEKQWLSRPRARVLRGAEVVAQADAAEAWLAEVMGGGAGAPSGLVWVRQGAVALDTGTAAERAAALAHRRDLLSSVAGEVDAMTGGRRMDAALARCRAEREVYATATGKPRAGGPWRAALDRVAALGHAREELAATAAALRESLDLRRRRRRELAELEGPEAVAARRARLDAATEAQLLAERHAADLEAADRQIGAARAAAKAATDRRDAHAAARAEAEAARAAGTAAGEAVRSAREVQDVAEAAHRAAGAALARAEEQRAEADGARRAAARLRSAREGAARRADLASRLARAREARAVMEAEAGAARHGPDAVAMTRLDGLAAELSLARAARDAAATRIVMHYAEGGAGRARLSGAALQDGEEAAIPHGAVVEIEGVGRLEIRTAIAEGDPAVERAQAALDRALGALDQPDLAAARKAAGTREAAERRLEAARAALETLAPDGIAALVAALEAIPAAAEDADGPDLAEAEAALDAADAARIAAAARRDATGERAADARAASAAAEAGRAAAEARATRAAGGLAAFGAETSEGLAAAVAAAGAVLRDLDAAHAAAAQAAPDLEASAAALARARSVDEAARAEIARLRPELARLDERIAQQAGDAVDERLEAVTGDLALAERDLARIEHEIAVLDTLAEALETARGEARERYFGPVAAELAPLLRLVWPDAELTWADDRLLPDALVRNGREETLEILSGGTREQIALLVRLAFARLMAQDGRSAPVILDDALIFSDDDRIERMFDALHRQAGELQIIVLTCRQRAFRALGGRTLRLSAL